MSHAAAFSSRIRILKTSCAVGVVECVLGQCQQNQCEGCRQYHINKQFYTHSYASEAQDYLCAHGFLCLSLLHALRVKRDWTRGLSLVHHKFSRPRLVEKWILDACHVVLQLILFT